MVAKAKSVDGEHSGGDVSVGNSGIRFNLGHRLPGSGAAIGQQTRTKTIFKEDVRTSVSAINGTATAFDPHAGREDVSVGAASTARSLSFRRLSAGDDLEPLLDLVEIGHKESRFGYIPFSREKARRIGERALSDPLHHLLFVVERRSNPLGFIFASVGEFHIGVGMEIAVIQAVYLRREFRGSLLSGSAVKGLFLGLEQWASRLGVSEIDFHITSGIKDRRSSDPVGKLGYRLVGAAYNRRFE